MLIVDSHVHTGDNWEEPVETLLYQMNANGVSHAVLVQLNGHFDNSYILHCAKNYGNKFKAVVIVDPEDPNRPKTLENLRKQGAAGMRLNLRKDWTPDDPLFKLCGELGMVISIIGKVEMFTSDKFKKLLDSCPKSQFCLEHLARSAKAGVEYALPPHDGYKETLELAKWPNTTIKVPGLGEIVKRPLRFPEGSGCPLPPTPPLYDMVLSAWGAKRMMWGSNFPPCAKIEGYKSALNWVRSHPGFQNGDDVEWIMGKSAAKLWGFAS
jgi:predicted TIM-barrel fold metal-dependent hydrolase